MEKTKNEYDLAFTHLKNNQNISAYNLFVNLAESQKKSNPLKSALLYLLAGECKTKQGKNTGEEVLEAGKLYLNYAKKEKSYKAKGALLCASKCFLKTGKYDDAKKAFNEAREFHLPSSSQSKHIVIIEDSEAVAIRLEGFLQKLGYDGVTRCQSGKDGIKVCKKLIQDSITPIVLLDMGLPDISGDDVASQLLKEKLDLQIILVTADEKTTKRVHKTISSGVSAFIQKPFTINDLKKALEVVESEF